MTLEADFLARVSTTRAAQLTNPDFPQNGGSVDAARLALAATDVRAAFLRETGRTFDDANPVHVDVGVMGVICRLKKVMGEPAAFDSQECQDWVAGLASIRSGRVAPVTNSRLAPTVETANRTPDQDRSLFKDLVPRQIPSVPDRAFRDTLP